MNDNTHEICINDEKKIIFFTCDMLVYTLFIQKS